MRLDYHEPPVHSNNPPEWHINIDGHSWIAKAANSKSLNHATSPKIKALGKTATVFKYGGRICFVAGIGMSAVDVYRADNRVRETVRRVGGWTGAVLGGRVGASLGAGRHGCGSCSRTNGAADSYARDSLRCLFLALLAEWEVEK